MQEPWGQGLQCRPLHAVAPHCFSTRALELEDPASPHADGWRALAARMGVDTRALVCMRQVHGADVCEARTQAPPPLSTSADIAITVDSALVLSVRAADCVPLLLADPVTGAVAAVHAGWQGTAAGAAIAAVRALTSRYGAVPEDMIAAVGPSIGPCCYEVGPDLITKFSSHPEAHSWFSANARPHLDLWRANRDQLARAGLSSENIHVCALCTFDHPALFHSYRRDGRRAGRLVAAIRSGRDRTL